MRLETHKGFSGRWMKKNWSQPIFDEMKQELSRSSADDRSGAVPAAKEH